MWHKPSGCDIIPLAKLQTLKQNTEPREGREEREKARLQHSASQTSASSRLRPAGGEQGRGLQVVTSSGAQTSSLSPSTSSSPPGKSRGGRCRAHSNTAANNLGLARQNHRKSQPAPGSGQRRSNGGQHGDRRSLDGAKQSYNNNGAIKYYSMPPREARELALKKSSSGPGQRFNNGQAGHGQGYQVPQLAKQRSLEGENFKVLQSPLQSPLQSAYAQPGQEGSLSRSISFMVRNGDKEALHEKYLAVMNSEQGRRSMESTPQSGRRYNPLQSPEYSATSRHHTVDGFPTPMINRRTHDLNSSLRPAGATSESEDSSQSPAKERRGNNASGHSGHSGHRPKTLIADLVDSGLSTLTEPENHR